jgi:hypothetical protein
VAGDVAETPGSARHVAAGAAITAGERIEKRDGAVGLRRRHALSDAIPRVIRNRRSLADQLGGARDCLRLDAGGCRRAFQRPLGGSGGIKCERAAARNAFNLGGCAQLRLCIPVEPNAV